MKLEPVQADRRAASELNGQSARLEHLRDVVHVLLLLRPEQRPVESERAHTGVVAQNGGERDERRDAELTLAEVQPLERRVQLQHLRHVHGAAVAHFVAVQLQALQRRVVLRAPIQYSTATYSYNTVSLYAALHCIQYTRILYCTCIVQSFVCMNHNLLAMKHTCSALASIWAPFSPMSLHMRFTSKICGATCRGQQLTYSTAQHELQISEANKRPKWSIEEARQWRKNLEKWRKYLEESDQMLAARVGDPVVPQIQRVEALRLGD